MKVSYKKRLEQLNQTIPDELAATVRWLQTLTEKEIDQVMIFLLALKVWWEPDAPRVIELPGVTLEFDEVTPQGNESAAMAICRHYGLDYQRTVHLVSEWSRVR